MDQRAFIAEVSARGDEDAISVARELVAWIPRNLEPIEWGTGSTGRGKFHVVRAGNSCSLFFLRVTGDVSFDFDQLTRKSVFANAELREKLRVELNKLPGLKLESADMGKWVDTYRMKFLADPADTEHFKRTWEWVGATILGEK